MKQKKFKKTFYTENPGLLEYLFNTGCPKFISYTTQEHDHYDDSINWAFMSER